MEFSKATVVTTVYDHRIEGTIVEAYFTPGLFGHQHKMVEIKLSASFDDYAEGDLISVAYVSLVIKDSLEFDRWGFGHGSMYPFDMLPRIDKH